ncbi:hypothetical protein HK100_006515 [Physocladia obscura]|uniref:Tetrapyrrole biosynthesis uroporphyrinogen III synthase domain-containing protein n=1 Tax=Physocladia obscura TaxID=109957 RepID=A0AAD5X7H0_9FUNG|nr:hypothetical protein HK100_006515 [Physocladia obscura]
MRKIIVFFRGVVDRNEPNEKDAYILEAESRGYAGISVGVLETAFTNIDKLAESLQSGSGSSGICVGGIVATSKRAVDAFSKVWNSVFESESFLSEVGDSSWMQLRKLGFALLRGGASCGNAQSLSECIRRDFPFVSPSSRKTRLLFLRGDKTLATLPKELENSACELVEIEVYVTRVCKPDMSFLNRHTPLPEILWAALFSPSGAEVVLSALADLEFPGVARIACIGKTTAAFVNRKNSNVDAIAEAPTAVELVAAISKADDELV